jgi:hypothetical protein
MSTNIYGDQECQFTKISYFTVSAEEMGSAELKKDFQLIEDAILIGEKFCCIARVSAPCYRYLQNWKRFYVAGEEGFSFLKNDTR